MTKFKKQLFAVAATTAVLVNAFAPVAFADEILVTGNGALSQNNAVVASSNTTNVVQSNDAHVTNDVHANTNSGGNNALYNTGGDSSIMTGAASSNVSVANNLNSNTANVACCNSGNTQVKISDNGALSKNAATVVTANTDSVKQDNDAHVTNRVDVDANSGKNNVSYTTGGSSIIMTGPAVANAEVVTHANANVAQIGGMGGAQGSLSAIISGNGALSNNGLTLVSDNSKSIDQDNDAYIYNHVDADANSGKNNALYNTGGSVLIATGAAGAEVAIDNAVNYNSAMINCGCDDMLLAKIAANGSDSYNQILASLGNTNNVNQGQEGAGNMAYLTNHGNAKGVSGDNNASYSVGAVHGDPLVATGASWSFSQVSNEGNVNVYGADAPLVWFPWSLSFSL